jgi:competence protein ComEC
MQNKLILWRASNPIFFICCYFLIGFLSYSTTKQYWPILDQTTLLLIVCFSYLLLCISHALRFKASAFKIAPTMILLVWGALVGQYHASNSFLSAMVSAQWVIDARQYFTSKLDNAFANPESNAFAKSLLFGIKTEMSSTLKSAYQQLGILHIIAISGMHLDILFKILEKCTRWLPNKIWARWTKLITLLLLVWSYTLIAHAGPSVVRASLFFSTILIGRFFHQNIFSLNAISIGIMLVLLYNSQIISGIGLQLSYAAVVGIHFIYQPLVQLVPMDNKFLQIVWSNLAISIAAQLTTLPIVLYYFHTSSSLSIIGNFLFVPLSSILLYGLLVLMVLPKIVFIHEIIAKGIGWYIETMNKSIGLVFQFFQMEDRQYNLGIVGLTYYYFCLFVGLYWLLNRTPNALLLLLSVTCVYSIIKLFSL